MQIRKNTKAFKTILEIVTACNERADRDKLIRLFITKAGQSVHDRANIEGIQGQAALFYDMTYQTLLSYLKSSSHQLHQSDDIPGVYFFHSASNKAWDELPFEFDEVVAIEFYSLPDLPVVRKKEKAEQVHFPTASVKSASRSEKNGDKTKKKEKDESKSSLKSVPTPPKSPQPDYGLRHVIEFSALDKVVFRRQQLSKKDILDYYNKISDVMLPYLKDRQLVLRGNVDLGRGIEYSTFDDLNKNHIDIPEWLHPPKGKQKISELTVGDKERLLFCVEAGAVQFDASHARLKSPVAPDHILLVVESPEAGLGEAIPAALATRDILDGLQLPSFVKTDGLSALHIYIPLDSKSDFDTSLACAQYICKLVRVKAPGLITLRESEDTVYKKVLLDFHLNDAESRVVVPYSLVKGSAATVATPLSWDEVNEDLRSEDFNYETIFRRLKATGDPFETFSRKKVDVKELLDRLGRNYAFLF